MNKCIKSFFLYSEPNKKNLIQNAIFIKMHSSSNVVLFLNLYENKLLWMKNDINCHQE